MAPQSEWTLPVKLGLALAVIGTAATIYFGLRPTDPAHPVQFDFLFTKVTILLWPTLIVVAGLIVVAVNIVKRVIRRSESAAIEWTKQTITTSPKDQSKIEALKADLASCTSQLQDLRLKFLEQLATQSHIGSTAPQDVEDDFHWDPNCKQLVFDWPEGLSIQIDWYRTETDGLTVYARNNTPEEFASYRLEIAEAQSWSETHRTFLPNTFERREILSGKRLAAMGKTDRGKWVLRIFRDGLSTNLIIGDSNDKKNVLTWQANEPTNVEIWRLTLAMSYDRTFTPQHSNQHGVPARYLLVRWDREAKTIWMMKYED
jgi:hypothetical protein